MTPEQELDLLRKENAQLRNALKDIYTSTLDVPKTETSAKQKVSAVHLAAWKALHE